MDTSEEKNNAKICKEDRDDLHEVYCLLIPHTTWSLRKCKLGRKYYMSNGIHVK